MGLVERIRSLCNERKTNFAEVERKTGISNGQIRRWNDSSPKLENVKKVAEYFNVSLDYLTGFDEEQLGELDKHLTVEELFRLYDEEGFEIDHNKDNGIETVYINHFNHGTVKIINYYDFLDHGFNMLKELKQKYPKDEIQTLAAHHDGNEWTDEELEEIERFKEFVKSRRKQ